MKIAVIRRFNHCSARSGRISNVPARRNKLGPFGAQRNPKNHKKSENIRYLPPKHRYVALPCVLVLPSTKVLASIVLTSIFGLSISEYSYLLGTHGRL